MENVREEERDWLVTESVGEEEINKQLADCSNYIGTFAIDEILNIKIKEYPVCFVLNLDERKNSGTHWIALYMYSHSIYICDSLGGLNPSDDFPSELIIFLNIMAYQKHFFITKQLQCLTSPTCGYYCILFVKLMCENNFQLFQSLFTNDCLENDKNIKNILQKHLMLQHIK